jgi:hypothetical protein
MMAGACDCGVSDDLAMTRMGFTLKAALLL